MSNNLWKNLSQTISFVQSEQNKKNQKSNWIDDKDQYKETGAWF